MSGPRPPITHWQLKSRRPGKARCQCTCKALAAFGRTRTAVAAGPRRPPLRPLTTHVVAWARVRRQPPGESDRLGNSLDLASVRLTESAAGTPAGGGGGGDPRHGPGDSVGVCQWHRGSLSNWPQSAADAGRGGRRGC